MNQRDVILQASLTSDPPILVSEYVEIVGASMSHAGDPVVVMPRYEPPPDVEQSIDDMMRNLDMWHRPGIPVEQFLGLYAVCKCGMAVSRRMFDLHECIKV